MTDLQKLLAEATPGPWMLPHFADDGCVCDCRSVLGEHGGMGGIAIIEMDNGISVRDGGNDAPDLQQAKANARLIAMAPDLAAALIMAMEALRHIMLHKNNSKWCAHNHARDTLDAIDKVGVK